MIHRKVSASIQPAIGFVCLIMLATPARGQSIESSAAYAIPSAHSASNTPAPAIGFPSLEAQPERQAADEASAGNFASPAITVVSSLAVVLGLFAGLVWLTRRFGGGAVRAGTMPTDVIQNLGSTALDARTRVTMLRCGNRIVVAAQTASGVHPLCEITDPREVHEMTAACTGQPQPSLAETRRPVPQTKAEQVAAAPPPEVNRRGRLFASA